MSVYLSELGIINALGNGKAEVLGRLLAGDQSGMRPTAPLLTGRSGWVGRVDGELADPGEAFAPYDCRNNRMLAGAYEQIRAVVDDLKVRVGPDRIAVILGTSTSGIAEGEAAIRELHSNAALPAKFDYRQQEIGTAAEFLARYIGARGPRYTISTACSSSAKAFGTAARLIAAGACDAAVVGGCDTLCELTTNGFDALESMSPGICNPFSVNRRGINVGEGAALFVMSGTPAAVRLYGVGESSDAYHMSAPDPAGKGAEAAIRAALDAARLAPGDIAYINLHGTATPKNDAMEAQVIARVFGAGTPCSSTKSQIGHTLGAAGAQEAGLCWLLLSDDNVQRSLPEHLWDGATDPELAEIALTPGGSRADGDIFLSNSFAFGGSNVSVILGRS